MSEVVVAAAPIRVMIVDDQAVVRLGLRVHLEKDPDVEVVGEASNRTEALALAAREKPNIILLDLDMNGDSGLDVLPQLLDAAKGARAIIVTGVRDLEAHQKAIRLGAMGLILKQEPDTHILKAVKQVHNGDVWFNRSMMVGVISEMSRANAPKKPDPETSRIATLTEREREVIALIGEGLKNKTIGERLFIHETTVRHHLSSIFSKLSVSDRLELLIYAYIHGLAQLPNKMPRRL
ncbi:MAG: response regulator [Pyrinomonadaceae bacterium]